MNFLFKRFLTSSREIMISGSQPSTFQLTVFSEDDERLWWCVACSDNEKVGVVKKRLISGCGRYISRLFYMGNVLDDKRTLRQCGINGDSILSTGRSASILRGKSGSRGTPDWSPKQQHNQLDGSSLKKSSPTRRPQSSDAAPRKQQQEQSDGGQLLTATVATKVSSVTFHSSSNVARGRVAASAVTYPHSALRSESAKKGNDGENSALHYTLSREEEKLVLEHKIKELEAKLAAGTRQERSGAETSVSASSSSADQSGAGVKRWPFRPFRAGLRTPSLPLDVDMFAKDAVTSGIVGASTSIASQPPQLHQQYPPQQFQQQQQSQQAATIAVPPYSQSQATGSVVSSSPAVTNSCFPPPLPAPHAYVYQTQPMQPTSTIYPDQGTIIAKPGFLGCPVQLFNGQAGPNTSAMTSMTAV